MYFPIFIKTKLSQVAHLFSIYFLIFIFGRSAHNVGSVAACSFSVCRCKKCMQTIHFYFSVSEIIPEQALYASLILLLHKYMGIPVHMFIFHSFTDAILRAKSVFAENLSFLLSQTPDHNRFLSLHCAGTFRSHKKQIPDQTNPLR